LLAFAPGAPQPNSLHSRCNAISHGTVHPIEKKNRHRKLKVSAESAVKGRDRKSTWCGSGENLQHIEVVVDIGDRPFSTGVAAVNDRARITKLKVRAGRPFLH